MRLPRVRFTVRRMMVAVAISAIAIGAGIWAERMWRYSRDLRGHAVAYRVTEEILRSHGNDREAERFALMRGKYDDAAGHPWSGINEDPPGPWSHGSGINHGRRKTGGAGAQRRASMVRVTVEILPKPDGEPYQHGEQIRCKGRITWEAVGPPKKIVAILQPGVFPDRSLPSANADYFPVKVASQAPDTSSGTAEWEGSIRANRVSGIDDYLILVYPLDERFDEYLHDGTPVSGVERLRVPR
jgi:hypothetical protein